MPATAIKMLVIEDDAADYEYLVALVTEDSPPNIEPHRCAGLGEALTCIRQETFDVVLSDLSLPDSFGLETFRRLSAELQSTPIIILTGNGDYALALQAVKAGAQDYLVKDKIDRDTVMRSIYYAIERHSLFMQLEEARQIERFLAYHDKLTKLPNRELFFDRLHHTIIMAARYRSRFAVLFVDLDGFKFANDNAGHLAGDEILQNIARRFKKCIRESDTIARFGGDEFAVIVNQVKSSQDALTVARKLIAAADRPVRIDGHDHIVGASVGVAFFPTDGATPDMLMQNADKAMYRAKDLGKNRCCLYKPVLDHSYTAHTTEIEQLGHAIECDELVAFFQPQFDLHSGQICGVEALVRWKHPQKGLLEPGEFIHAAERSGQIDRIDLWMLRAACTQAKKWRDSGISNLRISVNLSANFFRQKNMLSLVHGLIEETGIAPRSLCLEITESQALQDEAHTLSMLTGLRQLGVQVSMDDFGTGYASLTYLKRFPFDILKIDRSFVGGLLPGNEDWAIISAIINMCDKLRLRVVAEGVESKEQMTALQRLNCDECQGYYFSEPRSGPDITDMLKRNIFTPATP